MNPGKSEHLLSMLRYGWGWWVHGDWEQQEQEDDDDGNLKFLVDKEREWERRDRADNERRWRGCGKNNDNFETQRANFSINLNSRAPLVLRCRSIWIIISLLLLGNCWTSSSTHFFFFHVVASNEKSRQNAQIICKVFHSPSGNTCRIFRYDVVSRMMEALSSCDVMAQGSGSSLARSRNSAFSFSRRDLAAFLLFSFMAQRADKPKSWDRKRINLYLCINQAKLKRDRIALKSLGHKLGR